MSTRSSAAHVDQKLEVVVIPVSDVERSRRFYEKLGWRLDADLTGESGRMVQLTPPGSACSVHIGKGITTAVAGSARMFLAVDDIEAARDELVRNGADVSEPFHHAAILGPPIPGPDPERGSYRSFASFADPDGNVWLLQEIGERLPGRGLALDVTTLTALLREAEVHHGEYERTAPKHHWSGWYAPYIVARLRGRTPEEAAADAGESAPR